MTVCTPTLEVSPWRAWAVGLGGLTFLGLLVVLTAAPNGWQSRWEVAGLTLVYALAALVVLPDRRRHATSAGPVYGGLGMVVLGMAAVGERILPADAADWAASVMVGLHLAGRVWILVLLGSLLLAQRDRWVKVRIGLDTLSGALGLGAVVVSAGLSGTAAGGSHLPTPDLLLIFLDVYLVAGAVALWSILRPGRGSVLPPLSVAAVLALVADVSVVRDGITSASAVSSTGATGLLMGAACLAFMVAIYRPGSHRDGRQLLIADRLDARSNVLPFASISAVLAGMLIAWRFAPAADWVPVLVVATGVCLGVIAGRVLLTLQVARAALERLADSFTDPLTGLSNRNGLADVLDRRLAAGDQVTLLALDLADFRRINEEAGHHVGDRVLHHVAGRLSAFVDAVPGGVAARIDGDDFALAFPGLEAAQAAMLAAGVRDAVGRRIELDGYRLHLTVNIGTTDSHPLPGDLVSNTDTLLRCADHALARAQSCPSASAVHDPADCGLAQTDRLLSWVDELHAALGAGDQLLLHLQPQRRIDPDGSATHLVGFEALLRWNHPAHGLLGPTEALRAAAHGHLSGALTLRVVDLALTAVAGWWARHRIPVAVNLSAADLDDDELPRRIQDALGRHGVPAAALTVEVVEDTLMLDPDRALATLTALRLIGLRIAVDDYGTGYSSLAYLHRLPVDEVKFDRSLTAGIAEDFVAATIIKHSIELAHDLDLLALAEGVEEGADLAMLAGMGCDAVQGWLTGRPLPVEAWTALLDQGGEAK